MLVVNNGAAKSGTTWVQKMLRRIARYQAPPKAFRRTDWKAPSIHPDRLETFLRRKDFVSENYLFKAHYEPELAPLLARDHVVIVNCARSIPDMVFSFYHHQVRKERTDETLAQWVERFGLKVAEHRLNYLKGWAPHSTTMHFELMYADPEGSAVTLARAVGSTLDEAAVREAGRLSQEKPGDGNVRIVSGRPGAAREQLDPAVYDRLKAFDDQLLELFPERSAIVAGG